MKLTILITATSCLAALALSDASQTPTDPQQRIERVRSGLIGGMHDFSDRTGQAGDACSACHVPHVQVVRPVPEDAEGDAILDMYRMGGQREVFVPDRYMPGPTSLICLSCHNGTVATSTLGSSHAILSAERADFNLPETSFMHDHPIGTLYPQNARDYRSPGLVETSGIPLPEGRIECVSCHDPHDSAGIDSMLRMSNRRSALCLACHVK